MGRTYLNVPYEEKEAAKRSGAKWDGGIKKWYVPAYDKLKHYAPFCRWLLDGRGSIVLARQRVYLMESRQECGKCGRETPVAALALGTFAEILADNAGEFVVDNNMADPFLEFFTLAWAQDETGIPPRLMEFMRKRYNVKNGYSKIAGECLANHCIHCGAIQENWSLFEESDSPFWPVKGIEEYWKKMLKIKIYSIEIRDNLLLNWKTYSSFSESKYLNVSKRGPVDIGGLPDPGHPVYDYAMLYGID